MRTVNWFFIAALMAMLTGCLSSAGPSTSKMNMLQIGITKPEVIKLLGTPNNTRAVEGVEFLMYSLNEGTRLEIIDGKGWLAPQNREYCVKLTNGVVAGWGKPGDFNFSKVPETKQTIDLNINTK